MKYTLEICTDSVASAVAAQKGGAKRIELCSGLVIGGLSPDPALFKVVRANTDLEIRTLLRPRFGDFCYDEYEFEMLKEEVQMYREFGADGVVIGILRPDGTMNVEQMEELVRISGDMKVTMHRAFDVCKDPYETLEQCVRREVMEETGLTIKNITYFGSQPWPYPSGIMIGFFADYESGTIKLQDDELSAGSFFSKENLPDLPAKLSIARRMIDWWLAGEPAEKPAF